MANTKITNPELFNLGGSTSATQLPVKTTTQRDAMTGLSLGEMIFNSTTDKVEYWDGTVWYGITYEQAVLTNLSILSVAGGGAGGGYYYSGGGGAGGFLELFGDPATVQPNGPYSIIVGKGGNDASGGQNGPNGNNSVVNATGFNQMTSIGGGGGAGGSGGPGLTGGSGGGYNSYQTYAAGAGTPGQGNGGGSYTAGTYKAGGGGGGAGGVGFNSGSSLSLIHI